MAEGRRYGPHSCKKGRKRGRIAGSELSTTSDTSTGKQLYKRRAGIEGTISQGVRGCDLRHARYRGLAKTHLQQIATAAAMNIDRLFDWFQEVPRAKTRTSRFAALAP